MKGLIPFLACAILLFVLTAGSAEAGCEMRMSDRTLHRGESALFIMNCSNTPDPDNDPYTIVVRNSTGYIFANISGIAPANAHTGVFFYATWTVNDTFNNQNNSYAYFNITTSWTTSSSSNVTFNVSGVAVDELLIENAEATYDGAWYWAEQNALFAKVYDYEGREVVGAICKVDIYDSVSGDPFYSQDSTRTGADGDVIFNIFVDYDVYDMGTYRWEVNCQTHPETTLNNVTASGVANAVFEILPHAAVNEVYVDGYLSEMATQSAQYGCVNMTNQYRDYGQAYDLYYKMLCDIPNQDVQVISGVGHEILEANQTSVFCLPVIVPESAAQGTGVCRLLVGLTLSGYEEDFTGEYFERSDFFNVTPTFPLLVSSFHQTARGELYGRFKTRRDFSSNETLRIDRAKSAAEQYKWDEYDSLKITYNGSSANCYLGTGLISELDSHESDADKVVGIPGVRHDEILCSLNFSIPEGGEFDINASVFSQTNWFREIAAYFSRIAAALEALIGAVEPQTVGNYTNITSSIANGTVGGLTNLTVNYNVTVNGGSPRKTLHFVYEFAKEVGGLEGSFVDQNPSIEGYQALSAYQSVAFNTSKVFALTLSPNLATGSYKMYEIVYELNDAPSVSDGNVVVDERLVRQSVYSINVTSDMVPPFDGSVIQMTGVIMQAVA